MHTRTLAAALASLALSLLPSPAPAADATPGYHVLRKLTLGGGLAWDYLTIDPSTHLLYASHGERVEVVDLAKGAPLPPVEGMKMAHAIAVAGPAGKLYVTNNRADAAVVLDARTREKVGEVKTGAAPDYAFFEPETGRVFVFNGKGKSATAVDAAGGAVAGTVALGGKPERGLTDGKGTIFVNVEDTSEVVAFEARSLRVLRRMKLGPGEEPTGLALDAGHRRLFSVCGNRLLVVLDADSGKVVATVPVGAGADAVGYDPGAGLLFSANGEGTLTVIRQVDADHYQVVETVPTVVGARTLEVDLATHHVWLAAAETAPSKKALVPGSFMVVEVGPR